MPSIMPAIAAGGVAPTQYKRRSWCRSRSKCAEQDFWAEVVSQDRQRHGTGSPWHDSSGMGRHIRGWRWSTQTSYVTLCTRFALVNCRRQEVINACKNTRRWDRDLVRARVARYHKDGPAVRPSKVDDKAGDRITKVVTVDEDGIIRTKIFIQLQHPPDSMEPVAEPRRIQVDDRANVQLVLRNVSPLDVCTLNGRTPAMTVEADSRSRWWGRSRKRPVFDCARSRKPGQSQPTHVGHPEPPITGSSLWPAVPLAAATRVQR